MLSTPPIERDVVVGNPSGQTFHGVTLMNRAFATLSLFCALGLCAVGLCAPAGAAVITMSWSPVGNPNNTADSTGYGAVPYSYNIGTYDVTNCQYVAFLNSNDPTGANPLALYNSYMSGGNGGINFNSAAAGGSMYSVIPGDGNNPADYVSWYDAIRFANWMNNGQPVFMTEPTATNNATEGGAYTLAGFTPTPSNGNSIMRNNGATIFLPSEDEWYKAAYYNPMTSSYYMYPTSSSTTPTASGPTSTPNSANFAYAVNGVTAVGSYSGTTSPYGAYDMGGDVFQWNESLFFGDVRGERGGFFQDDPFILASTSQGYDYPYDDGFNGAGFRLASAPEPSSVLLAVIGCAGAAWLRRRVR